MNRKILASIALLVILASVFAITFGIVPTLAVTNECDTCDECDGCDECDTCDECDGCDECDTCDECPIFVEGDWDYIPQILDIHMCEREDGVIDCALETDEVGWWSGSFEGESYDDPCRVMIKDAELDAEGNIIGFEMRYYTGIVNFEGTVNGKSGRLTMRAAGRDDGPGTDWKGTWVILSGEGELRGLQGFGTFWGPGYLSSAPDDPGEIHYDGYVCFGTWLSLDS